MGNFTYTVSLAKLLRVVFYVAIVLAITPSASAQTGVGDVVRTLDGGMYRGTIVESVPNDHVTLLLPSGESRRFASGEILSSGPVDATPPPPTEVATADSGRMPTSVTNSTPVRLRITSPVEGNTLLLQTGVGAGAVAGGTAIIVQFDRVCLAPCTATIPVGNHRFVVEDSRGRQRATPAPVLIDRDGELEISTESRRRLRIRRWMISLGLLVASAPLIVIGMVDKSCDGYGCHTNWAITGPGLGLLGAGYATGVAAIFAWDRGHVEFRPY